VNREVHERICGGVGVRYPCATRLGSWLIFGFLIEITTYLNLSVSLEIEIISSTISLTVVTQCGIHSFTRFILPL